MAKRSLGFLKFKGGNIMKNKIIKLCLAFTLIGTTITAMYNLVNAKEELVDSSAMVDTGESTSEAAFSIDSLGNIYKYDETLNPFGSKVIIPASMNGVVVKNIQDKTFQNKNITEVILPEGLEKIGSSAFTGNPITHLIIPSSVKEIKDFAFYSTQISELTFSSDIIFGSNSFGKISTLKSVIFENGVTQIIGSSIFSDCAIESLTLPSSLQKITAINAFSNNKIKTLHLPDTLTELGVGVFDRNNIEEINIPSALSVLPQNAFSNNPLKKITLNEGLVKIGRNCFQSAQVESIVIPSSVSEIGVYAFMNCSNLKEVNIGTGVMLIDSGAFVNCAIETLQLPSSIKTINTYAFGGNALMYIEIPDSATLINNGFYQQVVHKQFKKQNDKYVFEFPTQMDMNKTTIISSDQTYIQNANKIIFDANPTVLKYNYTVSNANLTSQSMDVTIALSAQKYKVTFIDEDNSILDEVEVNEGDTATTSVIPVKENFTFIGWNQKLDDINKDMTVKAMYKALPTIKIHDVQITINESFDPLDYIVAKDADGKNITNINIIKNEVNPKKLGTYEVEFEVIDQWNGKVKGKYNVIVQEDWEYRVIQENKSEVEVKGYMHPNAYLIVKVEKVEENQLNAYVDNNQLVVGSFEVKIVGEYRGKIIVSFPIEKQYEGCTVYIQHLKKDKTIEYFTKIANNEQVSVEVDELSPFLLTIDKRELQNKTVDTNDNSNVVFYGLCILISLVTCVVISKKNTKKN